MRATTALALILAGLASTAAAQPQPTRPPASEPQERVKTADEIKRESVQGAATAPLRDLNVMRAKIPPVLLEAMADPYARPPKGYSCRALIALVQPLEDAMGPDLDRIAVEDQDVMERSRETALGAAADLASDAIPFRGWVRKLSGAERHDRLVRDAIYAGGVRRAYLKGLGEAKGCNPPATPSHEKAGTPPPDPSRRFIPRFPTRQPAAAPQSPAGTAPSAPRR
ncbi:hypothetical protein ACO2Q0_00770 [Phenylobacterium sp. VNQ135]|uniref:hypothetical protein n=1 Tax=Phenylobacterium sp. VNQ135 TaxID=3400922 RepID=UPI003C0B98E7